MSSPERHRPPPLPDELILQILARLPIKSLFRFRCVCKSWHHLPSSPHFITLHSLSSSPSALIEILSFAPHRPTPLLHLTPLGAISHLSLAFIPDRLKLRASSHGLLCLASASQRGVYYVCNPLTRDFTPLPRTRDRPFTRCQPDYEATLVGLAVHPPNFRVVLAGFHRPFGHLPSDQLVCQVFDSTTNAWTRSVTSHYDEFTHMNRNQVVFSCGTLHWLTQSCTYVLAFDVSLSFWRKIQLPDEITAAQASARSYLLDLEGAVSVVQISGHLMCIWVLKDPWNTRWELEDRVHLRCIGGFAASVFPVSQTRDVVFLAAQKKIFTYGRKEKVWREIYAMEDTFAYPLWFSAHAFRSTLLSCRSGA